MQVVPHHNPVHRHLPVICSGNEEVMIGETSLTQVVGTFPEEVAECNASHVTRGRQPNDVALKLDRKR